MEEWGFIWLMFVLKAPILALLGLVWWAIRQTDTEDASDEGGLGDRRRVRHPRPPRPPRPRRGPHGDPAPEAPPRVRGLRARARQLRN